MARLELVGLTPLGLADPAIAIAASRAGGVGVADLTCLEPEAASRLLTKLRRHARHGTGVRIDVPLALSLELPDCVEVVVLASAKPELLERAVAAVRDRRLQLWLECTNLQQGGLGRSLGVDRLIAKGNEAGGRVGSETTFILQRLLSETPLPVLAHGGIGPHTGAACVAAGAAGVVLDAQLLLTNEAAMPPQVSAAVGRMDGSETICLGDRVGEAWRLYLPPGQSATKALARRVDELAGADDPTATLTAWQGAVRERLGWGSPERQVWPLGQDGAFAAPLGRRFGTVGGVFQAIRAAADDHLATARVKRPLAAHAPLARVHATRYPIVQGPMTRVSDSAAFAASVADAGGLRFLALALMRAPEVRRLLEQARQTLGDRPRGVGILGFVPLELRQEQLEVVREHKPAAALIAGGRPDQALSLERQGIDTYLHVPSSGLLGQFIEAGARRFVFEGRECGGHVGPRSSFVLWETMVDRLLDSLGPDDLARCRVLFAGGIHDARSASMVAAAAAPLLAHGAAIGVLLGTAYLLTDEAVQAGAIVEGFRREAIACQETVLLESGPGHATRCARTPYVVAFDQERRRLLEAGEPADRIREQLEALNVGRLRIASKGLARRSDQEHPARQPELEPVAEDAQHRQGMYMLGQVAALRAVPTTIERLHHEVAVGGSERLAHLVNPASAPADRREQPSQVAIVGMACLLPKAPDLPRYWDNILGKVDAVTEVPSERWDWHRYFDADATAADKVYSRWGGFLDDVAFDPTRYGIPPASLPSIEPLQLLTLEVVRAALEDAGYRDRPFSRQTTAVILGVGGGTADLGQQYALRASLPTVLDEVPAGVLSKLPTWTEDSFPGILLKVVAGRVANRFDLGGVNYTVDAACASSLASVYLAVRELEAGLSDMVIAGGADTVQNPFAYLAFSKTHALSPTGRCRTFDAAADGIAISEGTAILVLKRLADAERDGDRIYAVIKGVAVSSDGRDKGLTAPRPEGQAQALRRAYGKAGFSPATVGLIEAHGTGTVAGDQAEVETLQQVFGAAGAEPRSCAIGSVKSMIGHTKCTAGAAGLIKTALALHQKVLPPTINVTEPNPRARFQDSPFYGNTETRPWVAGPGWHPGRAAVSAFGFGGTNFHAVLEGYTDAVFAPMSRKRSVVSLTEAPQQEALP